MAQIEETRKVSASIAGLGPVPVSIQATDTNPPFPNKEAAQKYLSSVSPPRDLVCPITQELYKNPVLASDGHTYEKYAIRTWFESQRNSTGSIRSPVTNAYIETDTAGMMLIENKAVVGMARNHRERLGRELCVRCQAVWNNVPDSLGDEGYRIKGLVEAGSDLSLKGCRGGNTAFMSLLQSQFPPQLEHIKLELLNYFIAHNVPVTLVNEEGGNSLQLVEDISFRSNSPIVNNATTYHQLKQQIKQKSKIEEERRRAQLEARNELNNEHRERQRVLTHNARNRESMNNNGFTNAEGLGRMETAWGFFPSLATLLFQGSVPDPPASFADEEMREKKRLQFLLRCMSIVVLVFLFIS